MFADLTNETIQYDKIEVPLDGFEEAIEKFFADEQAVGCNVTVPFKEKAFALSEANCNPDARTAKAVNTLHHKEGKLFGYTTDGMGLVADLLSSTVVKGKRVLLLGAGGAARGVVEPLLRQSPACLLMTNRTLSKAQAIVGDIAQESFRAVTVEEAEQEQPEIIINCTSASLSGDLPSISGALFTTCELAYDMVYSAKTTSFMRYAAEQGARHTKDGFGMLVEQAAAAFTIWTGKTPEAASVIEKLRP